MSPGQKKRLRRIALRATEPVKDALARGEISARMGDKLLYLPAEKQQSELERILRLRSQMQQRCRAVVDVLRKHLDAGKKDLVGLKRDLHAVLSEVV
jgi:hypothetical protein